MPYPAERRERSRERILQSAKVLFNRHGFEEVSIDALMAHAGLTRGAFYNYFARKSDLYAAAIEVALQEATIFRTGCSAADVIRAYLSSEHLEGVDGGCPLCALPSYVARSDREVKLAFEAVFKKMVDLFEGRLPVAVRDKRERALAISALCVGAMVVARALDDRALGDALRHAAVGLGLEVAKPPGREAQSGRARKS
ncbi:MAG TPA: helix-turn-helix domain-containing protein [Myxococcales bacterium]|nr:helix-turn-helix domain-containing protein [Myxococcales bacterium]